VRLGDPGAVEGLEPLAEHRAVGLAAKRRGDVNDAARVDAHQVAVVGEVMDRAEGEAVGDLLDPAAGELGDVRGLHELAALQRADRAAVAVGVQDLAPKALLAQAYEDLAHRLAAGRGRRDQPLAREVQVGNALGELHEPRARVPVGHEDGRDHHVLAGLDALEVDQRHAHLERSAATAIAARLRSLK